MRLKTVLIAAMCALLSLVPVAAVAKAPKKKKPKPMYYLALGDSLARGAQPNAGGSTVPTKQGYANQLYKIEKKKKKLKGLKLTNLGCLGESTATMIGASGSSPICHYAAGNQLKQAVKFLKKHKGHIALVTIDIGANDIDKCVNPDGSPNFACLGAGINAIKTNLPKISAALRKAAGKKVQIIGMTYYDPFLADWFRGASGKFYAQQSQALAKGVNDDITSAYNGSKIKVADVAVTYDTYTPFSQTTTYKGTSVPVAVAQICNLTWMCAPAPLGPNIHANKAGYTKIAKTFRKKIR